MADFASSVQIDTTFQFGQAIDAPVGGQTGNTQFYTVRSDSIPLILQRVWDTVNLVWCYFSKTIIDTSPTSSETTPAHSGSITNHNIVDPQMLIGGSR